MKLIVCLDDADGMLFNNRRQSKDRIVRQKILELVGEGRLWMNGYSAKQFCGEAANIVVNEDFLAMAACEDWCFLEDTEPAPFVQKIDALIIYRWNRLYPSDVKFPTGLFVNRLKLTERNDFPGSSHEKITQEVYRL